MSAIPPPEHRASRNSFTLRRRGRRDKAKQTRAPPRPALYFDMDLLIATHNPHKLDELRSLLNLPGLHLRSALEFPEIPAPSEDGDTFEANAIQKATVLAAATGLWTLADDSGLEVEALGGAPGVHSARYAGEPADYAANNARLLREMDGRDNRRAQFRCVVALVRPGVAPYIVEGRCTGEIITAPRGAGGFGYDPLFVPDGETHTFAELPPDVKNRISHRARAMQRARLLLKDLLRSAGPI